MTAAAPLLVVGLDSFDRDLALAMIAEGKLPHLAKLLERSLWGDIDNPPAMEAGATWPSFYTGLTPDRHGMYYAFQKVDPTSYEERRWDRTSFAGEPFWETLSKAGRRVAVVDAPYTALSTSINGIHVVDWAAHAPMGGPSKFHEAFQTFPSALRHEIESKYGRDTIGFSDLRRLEDAADFASFRDDLIARIHRKAALGLDLLGRDRWDCFVIAFHEAHCTGHLCWHLHDRTHPRFDAALQAGVGDIVELVYAATDEALGRLAAAVGPDAEILVYFSHGMGGNVTGTRLLDDILLRLEGFTIPESRASVRRLIHQAWVRAPQAIKPYLAPLRETLWPTVRSSLGVPRAKRKCFETRNNDSAGGIRLNIKGREPHGLLEPGAEVDAFCDALIADLMTVVNPETGRPIVKRVLKTAELFPGITGFPDLLVEWSREHAVSRVTSPKIGEIVFKDAPTRSGDHRGDGGLFLLSGPGIAPRRLNAATPVYDFAATILTLTGVRPRAGTGAPIAALDRGPPETAAAS